MSSTCFLPFGSWWCCICTFWSLTVFFSCGCRSSCFETELCICSVWSRFLSSNWTTDVSHLAMFVLSSWTSSSRCWTYCHNWRTVSACLRSVGLLTQSFGFYVCFMVLRPADRFSFCRLLLPLGCISDTLLLMITSWFLSSKSHGHSLHSE